MVEHPDPEDGFLALGRLLARKEPMVLATGGGIAS